mmetsp:Transcript_1083/g.2982  ORF Transcript_1083/g.2982 Transcript_1083/m.2982 type:complete len:480 (-) Transcript_1083:214-1653(-)
MDHDLLITVLRSGREDMECMLTRLQDRGARRNVPDYEDFRQGLELIEARRSLLVRQATWVAEALDDHELNYVDCSRSSALMEAVKCSLPEVVRMLLGRGVEVRESDCKGNTALRLAAQGAFAKRVRDAINLNGVDYHELYEGGNELVNSAFNGTELVELLLDNGAAVDQADWDGFTPLILATRYGLSPFSTVKLLLDRGADISATDKMGRSALLHAVALKKSALVRLLLDRGANMEQRDWTGATPVIRASLTSQLTASEASRDILLQLLQRGADLERRDHSGRTALMHAVKHSAPEVTAMLLEHNASVEGVTADEAFIVTKRWNQLVVGPWRRGETAMPRRIFTAVRPWLLLHLRRASVSMLTTTMSFSPEVSSGVFFALQGSDRVYPVVTRLADAIMSVVLGYLTGVDVRFTSVLQKSSCYDSPPAKRALAPAPAVVTPRFSLTPPASPYPTKRPAPSGPAVVTPRASQRRRTAQWLF